MLTELVWQFEFAWCLCWLQQQSQQIPDHDLKHSPLRAHTHNLSLYFTLSFTFSNIYTKACMFSPYNHLTLSLLASALLCTLLGC